MDRNNDGTIEDCTVVATEVCADNEYGYLYHVEGVTASAQSPFNGLLTASWWSDTADSGSPFTNAYRFGFGTGTQASVNQTNTYYAWAVYEGDVASAIPVPAAVWLFGSGVLALVGLARGRKRA
jgi:hypothetical protein